MSTSGSVVSVFLTGTAMDRTIWSRRFCGWLNQHVPNAPVRTLPTIVLCVHLDHPTEIELAFGAEPAHPIKHPFFERQTSLVRSIVDIPTSRFPPSVSSITLPGMRELTQDQQQDQPQTQPQATPQTNPSPLPETTDEAALLREFLIADTDLMLLADNHLLHIRQLIAWVDSEPVQKILADMERIAEIRTRAILAQAKSAATTRLAQAATQDPDRIPKAQIAAHESARKAASQLLRLTRDSPPLSLSRSLAPSLNRGPGASPGSLPAPCLRASVPSSLSPHDSARKAAAQLLRPTSSIATRHSSFAQLPIPECPTAHAAFRIPSPDCTRSRLPNPACRLPSVPSCLCAFVPFLPPRMPNAECRIRSPRPPTLDPRPQTQDPRPQTPDPSPHPPPPAFRFSLFAFPPPRSRRPAPCLGPPWRRKSPRRPPGSQRGPTTRLIRARTP